ncbi:ROK family protein [Actinopolyspora saharensis]|uniref:Sugar kinase of the NBD/HSP70 family, may contain an N-terminal HTH domain n=1 Tax=Actinopolyspora saharensis TaxID=995062 RepID=A0A1H1AH34_9ACTN|nr:ROK family protein [Actinopolyspora saharensis]SDQ38937.1 Sugar kinase of the NBD/HSP70 family, may contain an N-terminal HTH domain [Actinopolyspora saharensis]
MTASTVQGRDPASLRRHNLRTLLRHLHLQGATSRVRLGEVTGLTRSTIADLVGELAERGLAVETGSSQPQSGRGRPPMIVSPREETAYVLAVSVDVDTIGIGRVGLGGTLLEESETRHERVPGDPTASVNQLVRLIHAEVEPLEEAPLAVGIAVPGLVRSEDGVVSRAPNLGWRKLNLAERLRDELRLTGPIVIGNEARLAALAEHRRGAGRDCADLVYVSAGVGVGGGIVTHDRLLTGSTGYAGEVGHMITNPGGRSCHCGGRGCWETEIGADALLDQVGAGTSPNRHTALAELFSGAERSEPEVLEAFRRMCTPVAVGLANLINVFDPSRVLLGGWLQLMLRHTGEELRTALDRLRGLPELPVDLRTARFGEQGRLLGAAEAAVSGFLAELN